MNLLPGAVNGAAQPVGHHPSRINNDDHVLVITDLNGNVIENERLPVFIYCQSEIDKMVKTVSEMDTLTKCEFWCKIAKALTKATEKQTKELQDVAKAIEKHYGKKKTKSRK